MDVIKKNILLTGRPGVGKTTLIKKIAEALASLHPVGFYTKEIREGETRKGFQLVSLDGRKGILSHIGIQSPHRVGKYGVDVKGFEVFLESIPFFNQSTRLILIDEIGKMECFSGRFRECLMKCLNSEKEVVATIALKGSAFIEQIKKRPDVKLFELTQGNRNALLPEILKEIEKDV